MRLKYSSIFSLDQHKKYITILDEEVNVNIPHAQKFFEIALTNALVVDAKFVRRPSKCDSSYQPQYAQHTSFRHNSQLCVVTAFDTPLSKQR